MSHHQTLLNTMQVSASNEDKNEISEDFEEKLKLNVPHERQEQGENEEEFSFTCSSPGHSLVSAGVAFHDGQIRPIFPVFDQSLLYCNGDVKDDSMQTLRPPLRKLFLEERSEPEEEEPVGPFCEWSSIGNKTLKEASPEPCKKSNSTGFSKLWRFREHVPRSNSDGKDAFIFMNNSNHNKKDTCEGEKVDQFSEKPDSDRSSEKPTGIKTTSGQKTSKGEKVVKVTRDNSNNHSKKVKAETVSSAYEMHYVRNREIREGDKRRTYAPYRQDLVGFFTNVNGFSKNIHPF